MGPSEKTRNSPEQKEGGVTTADAIAGGRRVTLKDVAAAVGVDPSAISRVVNNDPHLSVSEETRRRIIAAVEEFGYRPNFGARGLRNSRSGTIGLILPNLSNPMYEWIVRGVETAAEKHGYIVMIGSQIEGRSADSIARLLQEGRADGLLVASGLLEDEFIRHIATGPGPVITVNRRVQGVLSSVTVDDEKASSTAVEFVRRLGHRRIGGIFGPTHIDTSIRRRKGFVTAAKQARLWVTCSDREGWSAEDGYRGTLEILERSPDVTAIYASTILMGVGALRAAAEVGRSVPEELSVLALHDNPIVDYLNPPLTTVRLPIEQMGAAAVEMVIERRNGSPPKAVVIEGEGELIVRKSTGPARSRRSDA